MKWFSHWGNSIILGLIILAVYSPALFTFLAQDDFTHLAISQATSLRDIIDFFKFKTGGIYYRPLSVQLVTFITRSIFGLRPFWFHAVALVIHLGASLAVYRLLTRLIDRGKARIGSLVYAIHPVHFMSLFWWAEVSMVLAPLFGFLALKSWLDDKHGRFLAWLVLALLSNELAISVIPIAWLLERSWKKLIPAGLITVIIIGGRWLVQPPSLGTEYGMKFAPQIALANLRWQAIRAIGLPEGFAGQWQFMATRLAVMFIVVSGLILLIAAIKARLRLGWLGLGWWILSLVPVMFLGRHQSPIYQIIGLPGLVLAISPWLKQKPWVYAGVAVWVIGAFWGVRAMNQYHWVTQRAGKAQYYIEKLQAKQVKSSETVVFLNSRPESSTQAYIALGAGNGIKVFFGEKIQVYFEDLGLPGDLPAKTHYVVSDF